MLSILTEFLNVIGILLDWGSKILVPESMSSINFIHVAIWTPATISLLNGARAMIFRMLPEEQVFSPTMSASRADRETLAFLSSNPGTIQRHIRQNTSMSVGDVEGSVRRLQEKGLVRRRWFSPQFELTAEGKKSAAKIQREEERAELAAQKAAARAVAAAERAELRAEAAAERAELRAERAEARRVAREEAKAAAGPPRTRSRRKVATV